MCFSKKPIPHLGDVHKLRNALGKGRQRFVTNHCKDRDLYGFLLQRGRGLKSRKIALRNMWTSPYKVFKVIHLAFLSKFFHNVKSDIFRQILINFLKIVSKFLQILSLKKRRSFV